LSGVKEERSISLLLGLDLEFLESTPKTLINSLHATARNFDTPSYWTLTYHQSERFTQNNLHYLLYTQFALIRGIKGTNILPSVPFDI